MVIFHIDLNAFYASAEIVRNPQLRGKPVVVGGRGRKGVVTTASYEARAYGIHSAMPIFEAKKLCPELVVVDVDFPLYESLSAKFIDLIRSYTPLVEQASIDECYADMTQVIRRYAKPLDLAMEIQDRLYDSLGLSCSIGIAPNKFLAKMASDFKKPRGITVLRKREVEAKLWPLPIEAMGGIGKKTAPLLKEHGICKIGDMLKPEYHDIIHHILGKNAPVFIRYAKGEDDSPIVVSQIAESMSQSTTLDKNIEDYDSIKQVFSSLTRHLCQRLRAEQLWGDIVSISIRYYNFETITRSRRLDHMIQNYDEIFSEAMLLFDLHDRQLPIRHLGVGLGNLKPDMMRRQIDLFQLMDAEQNPRSDDTDQLLKDLNAQLPKAMVKLSDLIDKKPKSSFHGVYKK